MEEITAGMCTGVTHTNLFIYMYIYEVEDAQSVDKQHADPNTSPAGGPVAFF